jgi:predicted  nucleic acid-binding Zn-ribbon protein
MDLAPLAALQEIDARLYALRRRRADVPRTLAAAEERVAGARAALDAFKQSQTQSHVEVDRRNLDLKSLEDRIAKLEGQLNQCKTNKEYALLKKEIDGHKADMGVIENEILQAMLVIEEKEKEGAALAAVLGEADQALAAGRKEADAATAEIDAQMAVLLGQRDAATAGIDVEVLRIYQRILDNKPDGVAIVPVEVSHGSGVCQGCYMDITSQEINLLIIGRDVRTCKNCSRILFVHKEAAAVVAKGKSKSKSKDAATKT